MFTQAQIHPSPTVIQTQSPMPNAHPSINICPALPSPNPSNQFQLPPSPAHLPPKPNHQPRPPLTQTQLSTPMSVQAQTHRSPNVIQAELPIPDAQMYPAPPSPNPKCQLPCLPKPKPTQAQLSSKLNLKCLMPNHSSISTQLSPHPSQPSTSSSSQPSPVHPSPKPNHQLQCLLKLKHT